MRGPWTGNPETLQDSLFYPWFSVCGGLSDSSSYQIVNFLQLAASAFDSNRFCTACWIPVRLTLLPARCVADRGTTCRSYKDSYSCAHPKFEAYLCCHLSYSDSYLQRCAVVEAVRRGNWGAAQHKDMLCTTLPKSSHQALNTSTKHSTS